MFTKELSYIKDENIRNSAKIMVSLLPKYFFEVPASSTGKYHPTFSLGKGGLYRHSKCAVRIAYELLNLEMMNKFSEHEKDLIIMALILHDGLKSGLEKEEYTRFDHPILMGEYIKNNKDKLSLSDDDIDILVSAVSSHMGEYNTNPYSNVVLPKPKTNVERFVHMCDFLASRKFLDVKFNNDEIEF